MRSVILENDDLRVAVLTDYGAKILETSGIGQAAAILGQDDVKMIPLERTLKVFLRNIGVRPIAGEPSCTI